ncbi:MAG: hydroxysqualene dehydroxylase HpnE [Bacteroidota bacterium]
MRLPQGRKPDVVVIGSGVSGLTTSVNLASYGFSVLLVEQKQYCGGRTYSFIDRETGDEVDNGQHLMMGCYHATLKYLSTINAFSKVAIQQKLSVTFRHAERGAFRLQSAPLPAPLNILVGLLRLKSLTFFQRLSLLRVGAALLFANPGTDKRLNSMTVAEWLDGLHQPTANKEYLWNIIAIGTLNDSPSVVSAALFVRVLQSAFMGEKMDSSMVIPKEGLSTVLIAGAVEYLRSHDCEVRVGNSVDRLEVKDGSVESVQLSSGEEVFPRAVVSAVPYFDLPKIFGDAAFSALPELSVSDRFVSSPIVTIHLWFDKSFMEEDFVALLDSPIHWVFNKSRIFKKKNGGGDYLSLVISGASDFIDRNKDEIALLAVSELRRFYQASKDAVLLHSLVMKEKRATFSPRAGMEAIRPTNKSSLKNLFLAGDWTDTKLPATIEGAAQSGYTCSELVKEYLTSRSEKYMR